MSTRRLLLISSIVLLLFTLGACAVPGLSATHDRSLPTATIPGVAALPASPASPATSAPPTDSPTDSPTAPSAVSPTAPNSTAPSTVASNSDVMAIQTVIERANQEQAQALAAGDPKLMQDTSTSAYYRQSAQQLSQMLAGGITEIHLDNLTWGPINLQSATTAEATTYETWSTTFADGSTEKQTDRNVYSLVLENGAWKVQDDQHPDSSAAQAPSSNAPAPTPVAPIVPATGDKSQSRNWSGYAAEGGKYTTVSATWIVPNVSAGTTGVDATWVGIGGVSSHDLIQAGTQATVEGGQVTYSAWWETLPQTVTEAPMTVNAGDRVTVSIVLQKDGTWKIAINDETNGQSWQKNVTYSSTFSSAEWIEEAPATGRSTILPLDQFGSVTFTNATAVVNGKTLTIAQAGAQPITMQNGAGQALAQPSALTQTGDSFTVVRTDVPASSPFRRRRGQ